MYKIIGLLFCVLNGFLVAKYGWIALLWSPIGFTFGLFSSANIILPIVLGVPLAFSFVSKNQMRSKVFLALFRAPLIWLTLISLFYWLFPSAAGWISKNDPLYIGIAFGLVAILLSPIFKKAREDFRTDFDKSYGRYYTDPSSSKSNLTNTIDKKQFKQIEATITVSSNLYLQDFLNSLDVLTFRYPDSRFRCIIFSLSTIVKACEDLLISPESLQRECLHFLSNFTTSKKSVIEFFGKLTSAEDAEKSGSIYLKYYMDKWAIYYDALKNGNKERATDILCSMIHSIEIDTPLENSDKQRLGQLCWQIEFSLTHGSMRNAFIDLLSK